jgi:hypothetical protein
MAEDKKKEEKIQKVKGRALSIIELWPSAGSAEVMRPGKKKQRHDRKIHDQLEIIPVFEWEAITVALAGGRAGRANSSNLACKAYSNVGLMRDKFKTAIVQAL